MDQSLCSVHAEPSLVRASSLFLNKPPKKVGPERWGDARGRGFGTSGWGLPAAPGVHFRGGVNRVELLRPDP